MEGDANLTADPCWVCWTSCIGCIDCTVCTFCTCDTCWTGCTCGRTTALGDPNPVPKLCEYPYLGDSCPLTTELLAPLNEIDRSKPTLTGIFTFTLTGTFKGGCTAVPTRLTYCWLCVLGWSVERRGWLLLAFRVYWLDWFCGR